MVVILMGVAGAGKTLIGRALAAELGWRFEDADAFHSAENLARMAQGIALGEAERGPWIASLRVRVARSLDRREPLVLACSALKASHRDSLRDSRPGVRFVHLVADEATLRHRLQSRAGHAVGVAILDSQLRDLEPPTDALSIDARLEPTEILARIRLAFGL